MIFRYWVAITMSTSPKTKTFENAFESGDFWEWKRLKIMCFFVWVDHNFLAEFCKLQEVDHVSFTKTIWNWMMDC